MIYFETKPKHKLREQGKNIGKYVKVALLKTAESILVGVEPDVPKDTGFLRESVFAKVEK